MDELIERARAGDPAALEEIFRDLLPMIKSIAGRYSSCAEYDDLIQTGAIGLLKAIRAFDPNAGAKLTTYAFSMIKGEIRHSLRADGNCSTLRDPEALPAPDENERTEARLFIAQLLQSLPQREAELIRARYLLGCTQRETAARLGLSQAHVSKLERSIIMKLRRLAGE